MWQLHRISSKERSLILPITKRSSVDSAYTFIIYIYIYIYIYIMSRCQHGSPWPSLATRFYRSLLPVGLQGYIYPVSTQSCCIYILASRPAFARPCEGIHRRMSLLNSSLLLQQWSACLVRLLFVMGSKWSYNCCFVRCCLQELFNIACSILM